MCLSPSKWTEAVLLLVCIWEATSSSLGWTATVLRYSKSKVSQNTTNLLSIVNVAACFDSEWKRVATFTIDNKLVVF